MLVPIGTLSAGGYSQWKVARILGVSQGCVSIILWGNRYTGSPHQRRRGGRKSLTTTREYRYGQGPMYHLRSSSSARGDDPPIWEEVTNSVNCKQVSGYIYIGLMCPTRCPGLTLDYGRRRRVCGKMHWSWDLRHLRHCVFSDESHFTLFHSYGCTHVRHRQRERDWYMHSSNPRMVTMASQVWGAIHHGGRSELAVMDGTLNRQRYVRLLHDRKHRRGHTRCHTNSMVTWLCLTDS